MRNDQVEVRPIAGSLGAEIHGVDLAGSMDASVFEQVHGAFLRHNVIFFRDQVITPGQQVAFARRFGDIHLHPYIQGLDEEPQVIEIRKRPEDTYNFGGTWHTDQAFSPMPALGTMLYAKETPAAGGDTMFANMYAAYETLSDGMKRMLAGLKTYNTGDKTRGHKGRSRAERYQNTAVRLKDPGVIVTEAEHPLVRTHPETGRKSIYISSHTQHIVGMTEAESEPLLRFLFQHATRPEFTCRFAWRPGSIALWDNRCTQHLAINDYHGQLRLMHRVTIKGDRPI